MFIKIKSLLISLFQREKHDVHSLDICRKIFSFSPFEKEGLRGIFIFLLFFPSFAFSKPLLNIQNWQTANGAQVYFVATPEVPMVEINVVFAAGSSRDGNKLGLAQLTNEMMNQGTTTRTADQIATEFDNVGAQYNDSLTRDMAIVSLQSLSDPKYLTPALQTFSDILSNVNFPQDAFARTQKQTVVALTQQQQTPDSVAKNAFYFELYDGQPYGHPVMGNIQSVNAITATELQNFYHQYYVGNNAIITIVGALQRDQAEDIANQLMQSLPSGAAASNLPLAQELATSKQQTISFPSEQTNIWVGQVGINYQDPQYFPLLVGNYMLGGAPLTSRLFKEVRETRGLAYDVSSAFAPLQARGPFVILLQTRNDQATQALNVVKQTLTDFVTKGPSEEELMTTKKKIVNSFPLSLIGSDAISNNLITIGFYHLPLNYLDTYVDKINAVTVDQIKQAFAHSVNTNRMVTVMVGNIKS